MSCDICRGFTFLLPSCVKGQSLQMGLWDGWGSAQQLCWPTALPCCSAQRGRCWHRGGSCMGRWRGSPPRQLCWQTPPVHFSGVDGAALEQEGTARIAKASPAQLLTAYCSPF